MQYRKILTLIALLGAVGAWQSAVHADPLADKALLDMSEAFAKNNSKRLAELLPETKGHLLEPWAAYWELRARLDRADPQEVASFFNRYAGTYQEDRLRNDWLLLLGQRRDWARYVLEAPNFRMNDDREVRCYTLAMENRLTGVDLASEVKAQWYRQKNDSDACTLAAQQHLAAHQLTEGDVWRKARLALEARQTRAARQAADLVAPDADKLLDEVINTPERFLLKRTPSNRRQMQELAVLALIRWTATNPEAAAQALEMRWGRVLNAEQRTWAWGAIGSQAAQKLSDDAIGYFRNAAPAGMSDEQLVWRTRASLRQGLWPEALAAIDAMSAETAAEPGWVYWRARALDRLAQTAAQRQQARELFQSLAGIGGFYEMLAQEELKLAITPPDAPAPLSAAEKKAASDNPGLQRALAAIALGLRSEGVREWNYTTNLHQRGGMNDRELLAAADLACQHEVWDRCINTSERTKTSIDLAQRFPMPHRQAVLERSYSIGLDPAYVYGLIRQESRFVTDARSGVGAAGLMQVMPATARWTAKKIGLTDYQNHQINDRDTNIAIGTGYLKLVLDDFAGSMPMAAAAYNAGPRRPRSWRGGVDSPTLEAAVWIENIPFAETRNYVKKVLANTTIYAAMISGKTQSLKARLGQVGPRSASTSENLDLP